MSLTLRKFDFSDEDYQTIERISRIVWGKLVRTVAECKRVDSKTPVEKYDWMRIIAEWDGEPVGVGLHIRALWHDVPNQYHVGISVLPAYRRRGIASAYFDKVLNELLADRDVSSLISMTDTTQPGAALFLEKQNFKLQLKRVESELLLDDVDFAQYQPLQAKIDATGIQIRPLSELMQSDPDYLGKLIDLEWVLLNDEPHSEPPKRKTADEFVSMYIDMPRFLPEAWFIATDGDQYVGWCAVLDSEEQADAMRQGITVIDRAYRRRGLATVMKLKTFKFAQNLGKKRLETNNAEGNPMLDLNLALGFRPKFADLEYKRAWSNTRSLPHEVEL